jgi:phosphatidylinositol alpha-mannosyltransferase
MVHFQGSSRGRLVKIGIVTQSYYPKPGGVTEVTHHTALELRRLGHDVIVITTNYDHETAGEPGIIRIGRNVLFPANGAWTNVTAGWALGRKLESIFRKEKFDIIQTHCPLVPTLPLLALYADRAGARLVGTFHAAAERNSLYGLFRKPLERIAGRMDHRIAVSRPAAEFAGSYFPATYEIIPNGIDCNRFNPKVKPVEGLRDGKLNILFVGRMDRRKGVPYLFNALPRIQRAIPRLVRLILVGEGNLRRKLMHRPVSLGGAEIIATGRLDASMLPRYYASADILCAPATGRESFGIVLLEAMASKIPIAASDIPGFRGVITDNVDGLLFRARSPDAIAEAVLRIATNPGLASRITEAGYRKSLSYDWRSITGSLEDCFHRVLGQQRSDRAEDVVPVEVG